MAADLMDAKKEIETGDFVEDKTVLLGSHVSFEVAVKI